ncbi:MAG: hypothetical protein ACLQVD_00780 [Capsulimonadaceae bacterium]
MCLAIQGLGIAVERRRRPETAGPVALVGLDGLILACSEDAERAGVRPGQRQAAARALCAAVLLLPYDDETTRTAAEPVWDLCAEESCVVEPISAEEVCLVLPLSDWRSRSTFLIEEAARLTGCPVRIGAGSSRFVARAAAAGAGPGEICHVPAGFEREFLAPLPVTRAGGLDAEAVTRLGRLGINTFGDVLELGSARLPRALQSVGIRLSRLARGLDADPVRPLWPAPAITARVAFEEPVDDRERIDAALRHAARTLEDALVNRQSWCRALSLTVEMEPEYALSRPTNEFVGCQGECPPDNLGPGRLHPPAEPHPDPPVQRAPGKERGPESSPSGMRSFGREAAVVQEAVALRLPLRDAPGLARAAGRCLDRMHLPSPALSVVVEVGKLGVAGGAQLMLFDPSSTSAGLPHEREAAVAACLARIARRCGAPPIAAMGLHVSRPADLSALRLTRRLFEPVDVDAAPDGAPIRVVRHGRPYRVDGIADRWKEAQWFRGPAERAVYRVETDRGLLEVQRSEGSWWMRGQTD